MPHDPGAVPGFGTLLDTVLAALRSDAGTGAAALWAALSDGARRGLGDEAGARRALGNTLWAPLAGHTAAVVEPWDRRADAARTCFTVTGSVAGRARFLVSARRGADDRWCLSGLRRDDLPAG